IRRLQNLLGLTLAEIKEMVEAQEMLREITAQYRPEADVFEKKQQLQKAIDVVTRQHGIVSQKAEQMDEMKGQLEERLRTFERWMAELKQMERKAPVA
ncbi:MAG: hypothetical protein V3S20_04480, partial [Dehalococcoidia bacterium]